MGIVFCHKQIYIYIYLYILYITCIHRTRRLSCVRSLRNIISTAMYIFISKTGWEISSPKSSHLHTLHPRNQKLKKKSLEAQGNFPTEWRNWWHARWHTEMGNAGESRPPGQLVKVFKGEVCEMFVFWPNFWLLSFTLQVGCFVGFCQLFAPLWFNCGCKIGPCDFASSKTKPWLDNWLLVWAGKPSFIFFQGDFEVGFTHHVSPSILACTNLVARNAWWTFEFNKLQYDLHVLGDDSSWFRIPKEKGGQNMSKIRPSSFSTLLILTETTFLVQIWAKG